MSSASTQAAEQLFEELRCGYQAACMRPDAQPLVDHIAVGGSRMRLEFASSELREFFMPALWHLRVTPGEVELVIRVWEGVNGPRWPHGWRVATAGMGLYRDERFVLHDQKMTGVLDMLQVLDARGEAMVWVPSLTALAPQEKAAPFMQLFQAWFRRRGLLVIHAGAVGSATGAALLVGRGGSGKSTTCAAARVTGMGYLADDHCLLGTEPPQAWSIYDTLKLTRRSRALLPALAALESAPVDAEKEMIFLRGLSDSCALTHAPLRAVVLPRVSGGCSRLFPATPAEALRALGPSSLFQLAEPDAAAWSQMAQLVRGLPCFHLELGGGVEHVPSLLREVLA